MTTQHSYDKGVDVVAQKDSVQYIFQCKNTARVGISALQEIWFAKRDADHVPVVVTRGTISKSAQRIAETRGIQCWDRKKLAQLEKLPASYWDSSNCPFEKLPVP